MDMLLMLSGTSDMEDHMARKLDKAIAVAKSKGIKVDTTTMKVLRFFSRKSLVTFSPSGFGHIEPDKLEYLSKHLKIGEGQVAEAVRKLSRAGVLEETKGMSSIGGREYWFGLAENLDVRCRRS